MLAQFIKNMESIDAKLNSFTVVQILSRVPASGVHWGGADFHPPSSQEHLLNYR